MGLGSDGLMVKIVKLLDGKVALSLSLTYLKGRLRVSRRPPPLPWNPWGHQTQGQDGISVHG